MLSATSLNKSLGRKYGRLLILKQWFKRCKDQQYSYVLAQCDCGVIKEYLLSSLRSGNTKSCGCLKKLVAKNLKTVHEMYGTKGYITWGNMIQRCTNPNNKGYKNYGGRGICVCVSWQKFENFYRDMGDRPEGLEIDRIDNNKGYSKENCHWTTSKKNSENKKASKYWFLSGVSYDSASVAAEILHVTPSTINAWCNGRKDSRSGKFYPPKKGCYSRLKYKEAA